MGQQATCTTRWNRKVSRGTALLESQELIFRGDFGLAIPFRAMRSVAASRGVLRVRWPEGVASFALGAQAEKWAQKILHPAGLLDKLGVKPGAAVSVLGVSDASFRRQLAERAEEIAEGRPLKESDLIFFAVEQKAGLARLKDLPGFLKPAGALWVVYPKGQSHLRQADVMAAGKAAGLVDVKVCSFSATHTALKFVIPRARR